MPPDQPPEPSSSGFTKMTITHILPPLILAAATTWGPSAHTRIQTLLLTLLALTLLRSINHALNSWSTNNWRLTAHPGWVWGEEIAVVTGGAGDIGLAIVAGLLGAGMRVAILDINPLPPAPSLPPIIPHSLSTGSLKIYKCDITSPQEIQSAASLIRDAWPDKKKGPSILINNAGTIQTSLILDKEESDLRRVVDVNMLSHWFTTKVFLPSMIECNKGHILSVASLASYVALPTCVDYSATKAGILAFHEGLGCEIKHIYKAPGVLTSIVLPDFVRTQMTRRYWDEVEAAGGTLLTVKEVADPVLKQIFSRRGGQIIVPRSRTVVSLLRGFPNWMQEFVRDVIGRADRDLKSKWAR